MVENEPARGVGSIVMKLCLTLEHRREGSEVKQPWFWLDGCWSLSFQRGSPLRCWCLEARNHQNSSSPAFHMRYKTKVALVYSFTNPYPLTWVHHRVDFLHRQQLHPIGRVNSLAHNARFLPNTRCDIQKGDHIGIQNPLYIY